MKMIADPRLPTNMDNQLRARLYELWREMSLIVNTGSMWSGSGTSYPTTGTWGQGDMVKNTNPVEAGTASSKYVVIGWICTVSGEPGTWLPMRTLTGN
jgi:hypothetical protein